MLSLTKLNYLISAKIKVALGSLKNKFRICLKNGPKHYFLIATSDPLLHILTKKLYTVMYSEVLPLCSLMVGVLFLMALHHGRLFHGCWGSASGLTLEWQVLCHLIISTARWSHISKDHLLIRDFFFFLWILKDKQVTPLLLKTTDRLRWQVRRQDRVRTVPQEERKMLLL